MVKTLRKCSESSEFASWAYVRKPPLTTFLKSQLFVTDLYQYALECTSCSRVFLSRSGPVSSAHWKTLSLSHAVLLVGDTNLLS